MTKPKAICLDFDEATGECHLSGGDKPLEHCLTGACQMAEVASLDGVPTLMCNETGEAVFGEIWDRGRCPKNKWENPYAKLGVEGKEFEAKIAAKLGGDREPGDQPAE